MKRLIVLFSLLALMITGSSCTPEQLRKLGAVTDAINRGSFAASDPDNYYKSERLRLERERLELEEERMRIDR